MAELGLNFGFVNPALTAVLSLLPSPLAVICKRLQFQQAHLGSSEYLFVEELGLMRKKRGTFPFYSLVSLLQRKYIHLYSFISSEFYSKWSIRDTWIPESTFFTYLFLKN